MNNKIKFVDTLEGWVSRIGYFDAPRELTFSEVVGRIAAAAGMTETRQIHDTSGDKTEFEFNCVFMGSEFQLYDYKGSATIHIGGRSDKNLTHFKQALRELVLQTKNPVPYVYSPNYDNY